VSAGLGITLVPSLAVEVTRSDLALVAVSARDSRPRSLYAATARGVAKAPATEAFIPDPPSDGQGASSRLRYG